MNQLAAFALLVHSSRRHAILQPVDSYSSDLCDTNGPPESDTSLDLDLGIALGAVDPQYFDGTDFGDGDDGIELLGDAKEIMNVAQMRFERFEGLAKGEDAVPGRRAVADRLLAVADLGIEDDLDIAVAATEILIVDRGPRNGLDGLAITDAPGRRGTDRPFLDAVAQLLAAQDTDCCRWMTLMRRRPSMH